MKSAIAKATALLGYKLKKEQEESVFQFASGKLERCICVSAYWNYRVDIKSVICGCINCIPLQHKAVWRGTRPFTARLWIKHVF